MDGQTSIEFAINPAMIREAFPADLPSELFEGVAGRLGSPHPSRRGLEQPFPRFVAPSSEPLPVGAWSGRAGMYPAQWVRGHPIEGLKEPWPTTGDCPCAGPHGRAAFTHAVETRQNGPAVARVGQGVGGGRRGQRR